MLTALLDAAASPWVVPWMLFTAAGLVFAWGGSGIASCLAARRGRS